MPSGASAPAIDVAGTGIPCNTDEQTITLTSANLSEGAKDLYIIVKKSDGFLSSSGFKIAIPAIPKYAYNTPTAVEKNGVTASVAYSPASPQMKDASVTATVTLSGTATAPGTHTVNLNSTKAGLTGTAQSIPVTAGQSTFSGLSTYTFTVPAQDMDDLTLTHTFHGVLTGVALSTNAPEIGTAITAAPTPASATVSYQWYTNDTAATNGGTAIMGETAASFTPTAAQRDKYLYVTAAGTGDYSGTAAAVTAKTVSAPLTGVALSSSAPAIGKAITATPVPAGATASYQWYTNDTAATSGGTAIAGKTAASFTPTSTQSGKYLYVIATGTGRFSGTAAAVTAKVVPTLVAGVTLSSNTPVIGTAITATPAPVGATVSYQWYTNTTASPNGGTAIVGETAASFTPTAAQSEKYLYVTATGTGDYTGTAAVVTARAVPTPLTGVALSSNAPAIGTAITATPAPAGATASYQWYTNATAATSGGTAIVGETTASFTPTAAQSGKYLYVIATGTGSFSGTAAAVTAKVVPTTLTGVALSSNTPVIGTAVTAAPAPAGATVSYQWYTNTTSATSGGTLISGATNASFMPTSAEVGKYLYVVATGTGDYIGQTAAVTTGKAKVSAILTPTHRFEQGSAPEQTKFTVGQGLTGFQVADFSTLAIDGKNVPQGANTFSISTGSLVINFTKSYLDSLSVGTHALSVTLTGAYEGTYTTTIMITGPSTPTPPPAQSAATGGTGSAQAAATLSSSPQTGDSNSLLPWAVLLILSGTVSALLCLLWLREKKNPHSKWSH